MNKQLVRLVLVFSVIVNIIFISGIIFSKQKSTDIEPSGQKKIQITAIGYAQSSALDEEVDAFKEQLTKNGIPFSLKEVWAGADKTLLQSMVESTCDDDNCDLILACGILTTKTIKEAAEKKGLRKPTFYICITADVAKEVADSPKKCSTHMTGTYLGNTWNDKIDIIIKLFPHIKKALIPLTAMEGGDDRVHLVRAALARHNIPLEEVYMKSLSDLKTFVLPLMSDFDLVLNLRDALLMEAAPLLAKQVSKYKTIFYGTEKNSVQQGLQCGRSLDYGCFGSATADQVTQYIRDNIAIENITGIDVQNLSPTLYLNKKTLEGQGFWVDPRLEFLMTRSTVVRT